MRGPRFLSSMAAVVMLSLSLTACGGGAGSSQGSPKQADLSEGTDIPSVTVDFGTRPYADNTFYIVGAREGYFADVGIQLSPEADGRATSEKQWTSLLLNRTVDINSATTTNLLPLYKSSDQPRLIAAATTYYGNMLLAKPELKLATLQDGIDSGKDFDTALNEALRPVSGKRAYMQTGVPGRSFMNVPFEMANLEKPDLQTMDDSDMLLLAKSGKADFVNPSGSDIAYELLKDGWTPLISTQQLVENAPDDKGKEVSKVIYNNGIASTADYVNENRETVLRFISVMYRTIDQLQKNPGLWDVYMRYQNSRAGSDLTVKELQDSVETLNPLVSFEDAKKYFVDASSPEYLANSTAAQIGALAENGMAPKDLEPGDVSWAGDLYMELVSYKEKADKIFDEIDVDDLTDDQKDDYNKAKQFYDWYDFLDAYRIVRTLEG